LRDDVFEPDLERDDELLLFDRDPDDFDFDLELLDFRLLPERELELFDRDPERLVDDRDDEPDRDAAATDRAPSPVVPAPSVPPDVSPAMPPPEVSPYVEPPIIPPDVSVSDDESSSVMPADASPPHDDPASPDISSRSSPVSLQSWVIYTTSWFGLRAEHSRARAFVTQTADGCTIVCHCANTYA
jgi:hypothetical protein